MSCVLPFINIYVCTKFNFNPFSTFQDTARTSNHYENKAVQRTAVSPPLLFQNILFFSQPDWYIEPDQNCTLPLVKNGKIGNTSCLIGILKLIFLDICTSSQ